MGSKDGKIVLETPEKLQIQGTVMAHTILPNSGPSVPVPPTIPVFAANLVSF